MVKIYKIKISKKKWIISFIFILVIIFAISFMFFYKKISRLTIDKNMKQIEEQSDSVIKIFKNEIDNYIDLLSNSEKFITSNSEVYSEKVLNALYNIEYSGGFSEIGILDDEGKMITSEREEKEFIYGKYFRNLEKNEQKNIYIKEEIIFQMFLLTKI